MRTIGIIPVRSGSKRFPCKNFMPFNDTTLIENTIAKLRKAGIEEIIISTDTTPKVIMLPVMVMERPKELAEDNSKIEDVILDVIEKIQAPPEEDYIIVLAQVTSPLWSPHSLIYAINKLDSEKVDSVISVSPDYKPNGAFYVFKKSTVLASKKIYSPNMYLVMLDWNESIDIDFEYQLYIAEAIAKDNYDKT